MAKVTWNPRGIPKWLIEEYLFEMGGKVQEDGSIQGDGWTASIEEMPDYEVGSLSVADHRLHMSGEADALNELRLELQDKLLRAGA